MIMILMLAANEILLEITYFTAESGNSTCLVTTFRTLQLLMKVVFDWNKDKQSFARVSVVCADIMYSVNNLPHTHNVVEESNLFVVSAGFSVVSHP
jgi:hypothetical protein